MQNAGITSFSKVSWLRSPTGLNCFIMFMCLESYEVLNLLQSHLVCIITIQSAIKVDMY